MRIRYLSHACFELRNEKTILIDPYFEGNRLAPPYSGKPDFILVTHEHYDHSDVSRFDCQVICPPICDFANARKMKIGEEIEIDGIKVKMLPSSHYQSKYPTGFLIEFEGKRLYHPGDTYLDGIQKLGDLGEIDVFFVPIGGVFTMNIDEAVEALKIIKPKLAITMHFNTIPQIKADPQEFKEKAEKEGFKVRVLRIGEEMKL